MSLPLSRPGYPYYISVVAPKGSDYAERRLTQVDKDITIRRSNDPDVKDKRQQQWFIHRQENGDIAIRTSAISTAERDVDFYLTFKGTPGGIGEDAARVVLDSSPKYWKAVLGGSPTSRRYFIRVPGGEGIRVGSLPTREALPFLEVAKEDQLEWEFLPVLKTPENVGNSLGNIQGDIVDGLPKNVETFIIFEITNLQQFRQGLASFITHVTTAKEVQGLREKIKVRKNSVWEDPKPALVNIAFSYKGLKKLEVEDVDKIDDNVVVRDQFSATPVFRKGQLEAAISRLGDDIEQWDPQFLHDQERIHGVILIAACDDPTRNEKLGEIRKIFKQSIREIHELDGKVRPPPNRAHEHFGFLDGISQPLVQGFCDLKNIHTVLPGKILLGYEDDEVRRRADGTAVDPPSWAVDGSYLVLRRLAQNVPEFQSFCKKTAALLGLKTELVGARMFGRWKNGTPLVLEPENDPGSDMEDKRNDWDFDQNPRTQKFCPYAAHIRKTRPRSDFKRGVGMEVYDSRIMRHGIQFGEEVTDDEKKQDKTIKERGLLFACYQATIAGGFETQQRAWSNGPNFIRDTNTTVQPGLDPIIGLPSPAKSIQGDNRPGRWMTGLDPNATQREVPDRDGKLWAGDVSIPDFVVSKGGEYFFSPSLWALGEFSKGPVGKV